MTALALFDRIKMQEVVDVLTKIKDFDEVTEDRLKEELPKYTIQGINNIREGYKDLFIDDYVFTIRPNSDEECVCESGYACGNIFLSNYVEVWCTDQYGYELQFDGTIMNKKGEVYLHLTLDID